MSWVIIDKSTGRAVYETFMKNMADKYRSVPEKYEVVPIMEYLKSLNEKPAI